MKYWWIKKCLKYSVMMLAGALVFGWLVMFLWNWLMVDVFEWPCISFVQALGLLILGRLLFGSFGMGKSHCGCGHRHHHWKHRMHGKWENMSDEEKEKFTKGIYNCGFDKDSDKPSGDPASK